jgi:peptidoglycan hydrolase CwlO-like protein
MPVFLLTLFRSVHFYIYVALLSVVGTLYFLNGQNVRKIEKQAEEIVEIEEARRKLQNVLENQNAKVRELQDQTKDLKENLEASNEKIEDIQKDTLKALERIDEESIPKEHREALRWAIEQSKKELRR